MYCTCSNKNNYEIISLCDIKKFTHKNGPFDNKKAWVQISIADILTLDCNKHAIEKIEKIYIDVTIVSTKIIETPISPAPNSEGMTLTGKKLLIDGFICSKIVYTSLTKEQSVYSSNFTIPFCTYIVIEANADAFNDKYCIKTCIEDVFLSLIDCKTIFQNVTIFLLAEKTSLTCPNAQPPKEDCTINNINPPNTFLNNIILNDLSDNPVITISFDKTNKKILVNSTGRTTDPAGKDDYFKFTLYNSDGITEKITSKIGGNDNGMNFLNDISNRAFQESDIVRIQATSPDKVIITNFPDSNTPRYILTEKEITFKITQDKLINYIPNEIIFYNNNNNDIAKITFNTDNNTLTVTSTGNTYTDTKSRAMALFKLRNGNNLNTIKAYSFIASNENANKFVTNLNGSIYTLNDVIEITTYYPKDVKITNFPTHGKTYILDYGTTADHTLTEFFKITSTGLQSIVLSPLPLTPQLQNTVSVKSRFSPNPIMFSIVFNTQDKIIFIESTTEYSISSFLNVKLFDASGNIIIDLLFDGGTRVDSYRLANLFFEFGYILELTYLNNYEKFVEISNFPTTGQTHIPTVTKETFKITKNGLELIKLPEIIIKKTDGSTFGTIAFDMTSKNLILTGFNGEYSSGGDDYSVLNFRLYAANDSRTKDITLNSIANANAFFTDLNNAPFDINYVLELVYDDRSKGFINITNFPSSPAIHTPTVVREYYKITDQGLKAHIPLPDTIKYLKSDGSPSYIINLDLIKKVVSCSIVSRDKTTDTSAFVIKINKNISAEIFNGIDFTIYGAQGGKFDYSNSNIQFDFPNNSVVLVNYPTIGATYTLPSNLSTIEQKVTINGIKR